MKSLKEKILDICWVGPSSLAYLAAAEEISIKELGCISKVRIISTLEEAIRNADNIPEDVQVIINCLKLMTPK